MARPKPVEVDALEIKTIELRLNSVKEATHRSRSVFVIMTIASIMILFGLWNSSLSWEKGVATGTRNAESQVDTKQPSPSPKPELNQTDSRVTENLKVVTEEWFKNRVVSVGFLGIRINTNDLAVIGSSSLVVIMVWFFFCQRRENRAIVGLLRDCQRGFVEKELSKDVCKLVYEGIVQSIVFINMGGGDKPYSGLVISAEEIEDRENEKNSFIRWILIGLAYLPPATIALVFLSDVASLFVPSPVRPDFAPVFNSIFKLEHWDLVAWIVLFEAFALSCAYYTYRICGECRGFSKATSDTLSEFKEKCLDVEDKIVIETKTVTTEPPDTKI